MDDDNKIWGGILAAVFGLVTIVLIGYCLLIWLKAGYWPIFSLSDALSWAGVTQWHSGWVGLERALTWIAGLQLWVISGALSFLGTLMWSSD